MTLRFVHTSDLQIGMTRGFLDSDAQARFDAARLEALARVGEIAQEREADFIVIAGDVFEHNSLSKRTVGRFMDVLKAIKVPVYLMSGNHDPLVADSYFYDAERVEGINVISDSSPVEFVTESGETVEIVGAPLKTKHATHDLVAAALEDLEPTDRIRVAVGHGQAEARTNDIVPDLINLENVEAKLAEGTIDYLALGDTHSTQPVGKSERVWFSGAPETTDFIEVPGGGGETNSGNALVVEIDKRDKTHVDVLVEEVPIGTWQFEAITVEVNSLEDAQRFINKLESYPNKANTVVKYALQGTVDLATMRFLEGELARLSDTFGALYERERLMDLQLEPDAEELESLGQSGFVGETVQELLALSQREDGEQTARDALNLLFRLNEN